MKKFAWLLIFIMMPFVVTVAASAESVQIFHDQFDQANSDWSGNWKRASSAGHFAVRGKRQLNVSVKPGERGVGIVRVIDGAALEPGTLTLRAKVRWVQGMGKALIRLQSEREWRMNKTQFDLAKLEYRVAPSWNWRHCWTMYRDGYQPTPQPISEPRQWSECQVDGEFDQPVDQLVVMIQLEHGDPESKQPYELMIDDIEVTYVPTDPVAGQLNQTCWTTGPLALTLTNDGSASTVRCELIDSQDKAVWHKNVEIDTNHRRVVAIPVPEVGNNIKEYRLRMGHVGEGTGEPKWLRTWPVWLPPQTVMQTIATWQDTDQVASAPSQITESPFGYWADDITIERAAAMTPAGWVEAEFDQYTDSVESNEKSVPFIVGESYVQVPGQRHAAPSIGVGGDGSDGGRPFVLSFPGQRSIAVVTVNAMENLGGLSVAIDETKLPEWLRGRVTLREMLYFPEGTAESYTYIPGPYVKPAATALDAGNQARYAVVVALPEDVSPGRFEVPVRVSTSSGDYARDHRVAFHVTPMTLAKSKRYFGLFSGPYGDPQQRQAFYQDMAGMGLNFPALYNLSPCDLSYEDGKLSYSFERFENELALMRKGGVLTDGSPMMIDMRFLESQISELTDQINNGDVNAVINPKSQPRYKTNHSSLEEEMFLDVLQAIRDRSDHKANLWPSRMLLLPEDEIEWGRIEKTERFATLMKQVGFETLATSDGIRWGWDGPERVDAVIDYRVYDYWSEELLKVVRASGDTFGQYTYPHDFVIGWAYHASKYDPHSLLKWTYYWPLGRGYYKPGKPAPSSGRSYAWPGDGGALPSDYTFEIAEATRDAGLVQMCERHVEQHGTDGVVAICLQKIQQSMPMDIKLLTQQVLDGALPRGNVIAWRQVLSAALVAESNNP